MLEELAVRAIERYQAQLERSGLHKNTSEAGRQALEDGGWPAFWEVVGKVEFPRACQREGLLPGDDPSVLSVAKILVSDTVYMFGVMFGNPPVHDDIAWQLYNPKPAPQRGIFPEIVVADSLS